MLLDPLLQEDVERAGTLSALGGTHAEVAHGLGALKLGVLGVGGGLGGAGGARSLNGHLVDIDTERLHPVENLDGALGESLEHVGGSVGTAALELLHVGEEAVVVIGVHAAAHGERAATAGDGALLGQQDARGAAVVHRCNSGREARKAAADNDELELLVPGCLVGQRGAGAQGNGRRGGNAGGLHKVTTRGARGAAVHYVEPLLVWTRGSTAPGGGLCPRRPRRCG